MTLDSIRNSCDVLSFMFYLVVLRMPPLTRGQQFLVIPTALGDLELKRRKMNGLIAELDTIVIPMIACDACEIFARLDFYLHCSEQI